MANGFPEIGFSLDTVQAETPSANEQRVPIPLRKPKLMTPDKPSLRQMLAGAEGYSETTYKDSRGIATIGNGYNLQQAGAKEDIISLGLNYDDVLAGRQKITKAQSDELFGMAIDRSLNSARQMFSNFDSLTTGRQATIVDLIYNMGADTVAGFPAMREAIINGNYDQAAKELLTNSSGTGPSDYAKQVPNRAKRNAEALRTGTRQGIREPVSPVAMFGTLSKTPADQAAKAQKAAEETGLPIDVVQRNLEQVQRQKASQRFSLDIANSPNLKDFMSDPSNVAIAHDDVENLTTFETLARGMGERVPALLGGLVRLAGKVVDPIADPAGDFLQSVLPLGDVKINLTGSGPVIELVPHTPRTGEGTLTETARDLEGVRLGYKQMTSFDDFLDSPLSNFLPFALEQGIVSLPDMAAILTMFPSYVAARTGELGQTRAVNDGRVDATVEDLLIAAPAALASAMLDRVGAKQILGLKPSIFFQGRNAFKKVTSAALAEAGTEITQEAMELLAEQAGTERGIDPEEALKRLGAAGVAGAGFGGTVRTTMLPVDAYRDARISKKRMDQLNQSAQDSKLNQRAPQKAKDFQTAVLERSGVSEVAISAEALLEYAEAHADGPDDALRALGVPVQTLTDAMENNDDITISTKAFVENILGTSGYSQVANNLRMVRGQTTVTEAVIPLLDQSVDLAEALAADENIKPNLKARTAKLLEVFLSGDAKAAADELARVAPDVTDVLDKLVAHASETRAEITEVERQGRQSQLDSEIAQIDSDIETTADALALAEAEGRGTVRLTKRLDRLQERRQLADTEQAEIEAGSPVDPNANLNIKARALQSANVRITNDTIRAVRQAFRSGFSAARTNVREMQDIVTRLIKDSGLSPEAQAKFIGTIKTIQSPEQVKALGVLQSRVLNALQKQRRKELVRQIKKTVKGTKARRSGGKPVGRFDADSQAILDTARAATKMTREAAAERLLKILDNPNPSPEDALEGRLLAIVAGDSSVTNDEIEQTLLDLQAVREAGTAAGKLRISKRRRRRSQLTQEATDATLAGKAVEEVSNVGFFNRVNRAIKNSKTSLGSWWNGWDEILDITFNKKGVDATNLINSLRVTKQLQAVKGRMIKWQAKLDKIGIEAFQLKNQKQLMDRFYEDSKRKSYGEFLNKNGVKVKLDYSISEIRKLWMEMQDPTIAESITHEEGNAMTPEMLDALFNDLKTDDIAYAEAQLQLYREMHPEVNAVYRELYGVNLPFNEMYSPIQRDLGAVTEPGTETAAGIDNIITDEQTYRRQLPGQLKSRTGNQFPLLRRSDIGAMHRYMHDMAHFIETAEQASDLRAIFSNPTLKRAITTFHGKAMVGQITAFLEDLGSGYASRGVVAEEMIGAFNRRFATSVLALKPTIGAKQLTSWFAMADGVPTADFIAGNAAFFANPRKAVTTLFSKSAALQQRGSSLDFELAKLGAIDEPVFRHKRRASIEKLLMAFIRYGDRAPIYAGGYAVYLHALKQGKTEAQAIQAFEDAMNSTQQSVDIDKLSNLQRAGAIGRTLTMFMTARLALLRGELRAWRQRPAFLGGRGKISFREFGKRMAYYHFAMPMLIQFIASGFRFDPDRQIVAMMLGQLNAFVIFGDILSIVATEALTDEDAWDQGNDIPLVAAMKEMYRGVHDVTQSNDVEDFLEAMGEILAVSGQFAGLPVKQVENIILGGVEISEGNVEEGTKMVLGYSPKVAKESSE